LKVHKLLNYKIIKLLKVYKLLYEHSSFK